jgi:hypothetical protein
MAAPEQSIANHTRRHPIFHFFLSPLLLINLLWSAYRVISQPSADALQWLLIAVALVVMLLLVRTYPLRVQDRLIRLEEQLRWARLLAPEVAAQAAQLPIRQLVALRFASDQELPALVARVLAGQLVQPVEIKREIRNWRGDHLRV